jgi:hypothetical protein
MKFRKNGLLHRFAFGGIASYKESDRPVETNMCALFNLCILQLVIGYPLYVLLWTIHKLISCTICFPFSGYLDWKAFRTGGQHFYFYKRWPHIFGHRIYPLWVLIGVFGIIHIEKIWDGVFAFSLGISFLATRFWFEFILLVLFLGFIFGTLFVLFRIYPEYERLEIPKLIWGYILAKKEKLCLRVKFVDEDEEEKSNDLSKMQE